MILNVETHAYNEPVKTISDVPGLHQFSDQTSTCTALLYANYQSTNSRIPSTAQKCVTADRLVAYKAQKAAG